MDQGLDCWNFEDEMMGMFGNKDEAFVVLRRRCCDDWLWRGSGGIDLKGYEKRKRIRTVDRLVHLGVGLMQLRIHAI